MKNQKVIPFEARKALISAMLGITKDSPHYEEFQKFIVETEITEEEIYE